jgi:signal transduction histidine kinase/ActR/RegA family two-component response regulator
MLLKNNASDVWLMSTTIVMVWLMLLVDSISFIILMTIGTSLAILLFHFTSTAVFYKENIEGLIYQYFGSLAVVLIFARQKNIIYERNLRIKAETGNKAKSDFIANMSHDLRTPLTGMTGMIYGILDLATKMTKILNKVDNTIIKDKLIILSENIKKDTLYLQDSTNQLLKLCSEILDISKLESSNLKNKKLPFNLNKLINDTISLLKPVAIEKNIKLRSNIGSNVPECIECIPAYFSRFLINIVGNALKFTDKGHVSIHATIDATDQSIKNNNSIMLVIKVEDTGIGIPSDKLESIFDHFNKLNPSYHGKYKGSGLGLYTVKQYLNAMNGSISVRSTVGKGSVFETRIPVKISDKKCIENTANTENINIFKPSLVEDAPSVDIISSPTKDDSLISVLVVEDTFMAAIAVKRILNTLGCNVDTAKNGAEAVDKASKGVYKLILMDIGLPDFSGIEAAKKIISLKDTNKSIPSIVALTGHGDDEKITTDALKSGFREVVIKPANKFTLQRLLNTYVT